MKDIILASIFSPLLGLALLRLIKPKNIIFAVLQISTLLFSLLALIYILSFSKDTYISLPWLSFAEYQINISFYLDYTLLLVSIIVVFITIMISIYSFYYLKEKYSYRRYLNFLCLINVFLFALLGFAFADSLLLLFIFWEVMGFCSFKLISFDQDKNLAASAGIKAVIINKIGDLGFMFSIALVFLVFRSFDINFIRAELLNLGLYAFPNHLYFNVIGIGLVLAAIIKSGQMPFSGWLSSAMEAPIPASALIHSSTIVIIGALLIYKVNFIIADFLYIILALIGAVSAALASLIAIYQNDIKKILAYSTISQIGYIYSAIGLKDFQIAFLHLIIHVFFKSLLFLLAGLLINICVKKADRSFGNVRSLDSIKSIRGYLDNGIKYMVVIGLWSLSGLPISASYLSKEVIVSKLFSNLNYINTILFVLIIISMACTAIYSAKIASAIFPKTIINKRSYSFKVTPIIAPLLIISFFCVFFSYSWSPFHLAPFMLSDLVLGQYEVDHNYYLSISISIFILLLIIVFYIKYSRVKTYVYTSKIARFFYKELYLEFLYKFILQLFISLSGILKNINDALNNTFNVLEISIKVLAQAFKKFDLWINDKCIGFLIIATSIFSKRLSGIALGNLQIILLVSLVSLIITFFVVLCFFT